MPRSPPITFTPLGDTHPFTPNLARPVRVRARSMPTDSHFEPHRHSWAQLAYCATGTLQVVVRAQAQAAFVGQPDPSKQRKQHKAPEEITYIVPPSRAVWIAPGALHAIHVLKLAEFRTLYMDASITPSGWTGCRVIVVSPLLRELVQALDQANTSLREQSISHLVMDEITQAHTQALGVPLPHPQTGDKRLRALCQAVMHAPAEHATLAEWAANIGASERTVARLFRDELGMSYHQWRQQAILAHALPMLASGKPVSTVAAASGYSSDSAFSAMFKAAMGQPPSQFQGK